MNIEYREYDNIVTSTIRRILDISENNGMIILDKFDMNNPEHLYVLNIANICTVVNDIDRKIYLKMNVFKYHKFKQYYNIDTERLSFMYGNPTNIINIDRLLEKQAEEENFSREKFKEIYNIYYNI